MKALICLLTVMLLTACERDGTYIGQEKQTQVYSRCLETSTGVGVGVGSTSSGQPATVVTTSSHCVRAQEVWVTEEWRYNKWQIKNVDLK